MLPAAEVAFGPYLLDSRSRSLSRGGEPVGLSPHEFEVLHLLVRRPNVVVSKDALIQAGWHDTAVGDNSLEKLVGKLRRQLDAGDLNRYIKTVARQGYQFVGSVLEVETQTAASHLELLLAPHRAFTEGRVAPGIVAVQPHQHRPEHVRATAAAASRRRGLSDRHGQRVRDAVRIHPHRSGAGCQ